MMTEWPVDTLTSCPLTQMGRGHVSSGCVFSHSPSVLRFWLLRMKASLSKHPEPSFIIRRDGSRQMALLGSERWQTEPTFQDP